MEPIRWPFSPVSRGLWGPVNFPQNLPPCQLDLIAQFAQDLRDFLAVVALDLDYALFQRAAAAAGLFELLARAFRSVSESAIP